MLLEIRRRWPGNFTSLARSGEKRKEIAENARKRMQQWHYRETANQLEAALRHAETLRGRHGQGAWR